ncbi:MAG: isocitrate lyase/phosphoenolpyruvate mutase family protein, partial [Marivirga sp.]|nr:isocitrate lyase/phosphoenolpyruvate mutase family protein [Marivirga sp.]
GKNDDEISANIVKLADMGVAGINIEDSIVTGSKRSLKDPSSFARTVRFIRSKLEEKKLELFINIRCDTYILNVTDKEQETINRLKIYNTAGADGIFLPCISHAKDIDEAMKHIGIPLNVMCIPGIPGIQELNRLGVKRVSMGPFMFQKVYAAIGELTRAISVKQDFSPILP